LGEVVITLEYAKHEIKKTEVLKDGIEPESCQATIDDLWYYEDHLDWNSLRRSLDSCETLDQSEPATPSEYHHHDEDVEQEAELVQLEQSGQHELHRGQEVIV
jgi:hypothetical protein